MRAVKNYVKFNNPFELVTSTTSVSSRNVTSNEFIECLNECDELRTNFGNAKLLCPKEPIQKDKVYKIFLVYSEHKGEPIGYKYELCDTLPIGCFDGSAGDSMAFVRAKHDAFRMKLNNRFKPIKMSQETVDTIIDVVEQVDMYGTGYFKCEETKDFFTSYGIYVKFNGTDYEISF